MGGQKTLYLPYNLFDAFDAFFDRQLLPAWFGDVYEVPSQLPTNIYHEQGKKDLIFEMAVAGYKQEDISIDYDRDYLIIKVGESGTDINDPSISGNRDYIVRTLKKSRCTMKYFVPENFYDQSSTKASIEDGILKIFIPALEKRKDAKKIGIEIKK